MSGRRKRNSSKVNLTISLVFHTALVLAIFFLAAREGMLGKKLKEITVTMAPKEKKPEPPKEKPPEPKVEQAKQAEAPKMVATAPPPRAETVAPAAAAPPMAAPPTVDLPTMDFTDGAKQVQSVSDPNVLYKGLVEHALRSNWERPEDISDDSYVAEVELSIDGQGKVVANRWLQGSGDARWDKSVKVAVGATKTIGRPPPKGFPGSFRARFDVEMFKTEEVIKLSSR